MTATSQILPKLALNFLNASLDSRVTFTRTTGASNPATYVDSSGYIASATNNQPRFDYNPITLACKGLLIEESRTNLLTYSQVVGGTNWSVFKFGVALLPVVTTNFATAPDNTLTASRIEMSLGGGTTTADYAVLQHSIITITTATSYTASIYLKSNTESSYVVIFRDDLGVSPSQLWTVTPTWQRFTVTYTSSTVAAYGVKLWLRGTLGTSSTADILAWGGQYEAGAFGTSYIPVVATTLTRNPDVAVMTGTNFSDWWQAFKGGTQVQATPSTVSGIRPLVQYDDGTANEIIALRGNTTNPELYIVDGGTPQAQLDAGTIAANTSYSLTGWWSTNDCKARKDAGAVVTDTTATIPMVTQARLGSDGTNYLNGTLATINYYDKFSGQIYTRRKNKAIFSLL